ncbi:uncharacterized protein LOC144883173 [Branchiostoma floridae x Branchiostoma japonicum]
MLQTDSNSCTFLAIGGYGQSVLPNYPWPVYHQRYLQTGFCEYSFLLSAQNSEGACLLPANVSTRLQEIERDRTLEKQSLKHLSSSHGQLSEQVHNLTVDMNNTAGLTRLVEDQIESMRAEGLEQNQTIDELKTRVRQQNQDLEDLKTLVEQQSDTISQYETRFSRLESAHNSFETLDSQLQSLKSQVALQTRSLQNHQRNHLVYVQRCESGIAYTGYAMHGHGVRAQDLSVRFRSAFRTTPVVTVGLRQLDHGNQNVRVTVAERSVTRTGMTVRVGTFADSVLYGATVNWMACA